MSEQPNDLVWQMARARMLAAFDRQRSVGIATHGQPLPVSIPGMDMADERLFELVDAIVYETAELVQRGQLREENAILRARVAELEAERAEAQSGGGES